jgi:cysteine desulfurase family protein (TIGR01976 family)
MKSFDDCRADFPSLERRVDGRPLAYFDGPGGTQVPQPVIDAIASYYETSNANTHGPFATRVETDRVIQGARQSAADFLGAGDASSISFGQNMTTLNFALARAIGRTLEAGDEIVVTALDHEANRGPWLSLQERGAVIRELPFGKDGVLEMHRLEDLLSAKTRVVAIGLASNALGTVNDVARARELTRRGKAMLVVDAVHYAPHFALDAAALDPDFLLCSAYKFYGPHVGILYSREGLLDTLPTDRLVTAEQAAPGRIETGTLNHAALAGVTAAIDYIASFGSGESRRDRIVDAMGSLARRERTHATRYARAVADLEGLTLYGPPFEGERAPTVSFSILGMSAREVTERLARQAIAAWDGDFYARRAVELLGLTDAGGLVRCGMAMYTSDEDVDRLIEAVQSVARSVRN